LVIHQTVPIAPERPCRLDFWGGVEAMNAIAIDCWLRRGERAVIVTGIA
jgi:hypothetical protein